MSKRSVSSMCSDAHPNLDCRTYFLEIDQTSEFKSTKAANERESMSERERGRMIANNLYMRFLDH